MSHLQRRLVAFCSVFIKTDSGRGEVGGGRASRTGEGDGGALARNWAKMGWMRGHTELGERVRRQGRTGRK